MSHKLFTCLIQNTKSKTEDRVITGVAAVFGNVDAGGDLVKPGAFRQAIQNFKSGRSRARFLWNHDGQQPPIAKILELKEVSRAELPAAVLAKAPEATGGLVVKRKYFTDSFSERVYQGILSGAISEMSFAYDTKKSSFIDQDGKRVRVLEELELFDLSDVQWGMNPATVAAGAKGRLRGKRGSVTASVKSRIRSLRVAASKLPMSDSEKLQFRADSLRLDALKLQHGNTPKSRTAKARR